MIIIGFYLGFVTVEASPSQEFTPPSHPMALFPPLLPMGYVSFYLLFIYFKFHVVQLCQFVFWFLYFMSCTLKIMFFVSKTLNLYIKDNKEGML